MRTRCVASCSLATVVFQCTAQAIGDTSAQLSCFEQQKAALQLSCLAYRSMLEMHVACTALSRTASVRFCPKGEVI